MLFHLVKLTSLNSLQNTMTDSTIFLEDVQKMKDKGEIAQAYIGLKETNRYVFFNCVFSDGFILSFSSHC